MYRPINTVYTPHFRQICLSRSFLSFLHVKLSSRASGKQNVSCHCSPIGIRCGNDAEAVVAICVDISTHSADVAQNQPNIAVVSHRNGRQEKVDVARRVTCGWQLLSPPGDGVRHLYSSLISPSITIYSSMPPMQPSIRASRQQSVMG